MIDLPTPNKVQEFLLSNKAKDIAGAQSSQNHAIIIILVLFLIIGIVTISIIFVGYVNTNKKKLRKEWKNLRCKPQYMPFASMLGPKGSSFGKNFSSCMSSFFEDSFNHYIEPYLKMFTSLTGIVAGISDSVQRIREMLTVIRDNIEDYAKVIILRLKMVFYRIMNLFRILQAFFWKIAGVFMAQTDFFKYIYFLGASLWNGPAGWFFRFFLGALDNDCCFDGDTIIEMEKGISKKISEIKVGDKLKKGGKVMGIMKFESKTPMYRYNDVLVSGNHRVYSSKTNKFKMIKNIDEAVKVDNYNSENIYCINTESGRIEINNNVFMDYRDCKNIDEEIEINQKVYKKLNNTEISKTITPSGFGGISGNTLVKMENDKWKPLSDITIGDILYNNNKVYGTVYVESLCSKICDDYYLAASQLIKINNKYEFFNKIDYNLNLYQIFCSDHEFIIKIENEEYIVRDYEQIKL